MPSVLDVPELMEYIETHDLTVETRARRETRREHPGFWRPLTFGISTYLSSLWRERHAPSCYVRRPFETSMDCFAREHPALAPYALAMI